MLRPRPLRTVHASFPAYGSSVGQRAFTEHWARGAHLGSTDPRRPCSQPWRSAPMAKPPRRHTVAPPRGNLDVTTAVPATELPAVVGAAPATAVTAAPTFLLCPLRRLADGSRPPTPEGSLPACAWGDVATPIQPITDRPSLAPSSFTRCPIRSSYDFLCCPRAAGQRAYHVPQVEPYGWFRSRLSAGGTPSAPGKFGIPGPDHMPFGPSLISQPPRGGHDYRRSATASLACPM